MILKYPLATIDEIEEIGAYHVERAYISSDDLTKRILRVTSDHGNEYGIRLDDAAPALSRGSAFKVGEGKLLVIETIPDKMLKVTPRSMDEMGQVAHYLGNLHKPVEVSDGQITLLYDPVVDRDLAREGISVEVVEMELDHPLRHIDLTHLAGGSKHHPKGLDHEHEFHEHVRTPSAHHHHHGEGGLELPEEHAHRHTHTHEHVHYHSHEHTHEDGVTHTHEHAHVHTHEHTHGFGEDHHHHHHYEDEEL